MSSKCPTGKVVYISPTLAEDALIEAWVRNNYRMGSGPVNVYQCDDCRNFHFTSKGNMNERLKKEWQDGSISRSQRVLDFERKLKR